MTEGTQRRLTTIVAADIAGFSRLVGIDEEGTLAAQRSHRVELIEPLLAEHHGRIANTAGDSFLLEFPSAVEAVRCSIAVQEGMADRNQDVAADQRIEYRIGINVGDVVADGDDLLGDGVNIAARLENLCEPSGIILSDDAYRQVRDRLDVAWEDGGEHEVKNIVRPVKVWRWRAVVEAIAPTSGEAPLALPDKPSIAVLPFDNMSGDPEQEYFSDGVTEDIITALSKFRWFFVTARNSSFVYKGAAVDIKQVGRELGVRYVLEGSVRKAGDRIRITAQLIEAESGNHIWVERYDRKLQDIFDLQDEITQTISAAIAPELVHSEHERSLLKPTDNLDAWDYYLRGAANFSHVSREHAENCIDFMRLAVAADPNFDTAHAWLAWAAYVQLAFHWTDDIEQTLEQALADAKKAIAINQRSYFAHFVLGKLLVQKDDLAAAFREMELAVSINPSFALGYYGLGSAYTFAGDGERGLANIDLAIRLSPNDPIMWAHFAYKAGALELLGRREEAISVARQACEYPNAQYLVFTSLASLYANDGQMENAAAALQRARQLKPGLTLGQVEDFYAAGHPRFVDSIIGGLRKAGLSE